MLGIPTAPLPSLATKSGLREKLAAMSKAEISEESETGRIYLTMDNG
jgi:hypothetical protein